MPFKLSPKVVDVLLEKLSSDNGFRDRFQAGLFGRRKRFLQLPFTRSEGFEVHPDLETERFLQLPGGRPQRRDARALLGDVGALDLQRLLSLLQRPSW